MGKQAHLVAIGNLDVRMTTAIITAIILEGCQLLKTAHLAWTANKNGIYVNIKANHKYMVHVPVSGSKHKT